MEQREDQLYREFYEAERDYWDAHYLYCDPEEGCYC